jgi:uncharacterized low-complexity protein
MRFAVRISLLVLFAAATVALSASAAQAIEVERLFAANCKAGHENCGEGAVGPKTEKEAEEAGEQESGAYVPFGVSDFVIKSVEPVAGLKFPVGYPNGSVKNARFDAGPGVVTNPFAVPRCEMKDFMAKELDPVHHLFSEPECNKNGNTIIGEQAVEVVLPDPTEPVEPKKFKDYKLKGKVYNLDPPNGLASDFGVALDLKEYLKLPFSIFSHSFIEGSVEWASDYHDYYLIKNITPGLIESRLVLFGNKNVLGESTGFIRNPSACVVKGPETTSTLSVESYEEVKAPLAEYTDLVGTINCGLEKFEPAFKLTPESALSDSPDGITTEVTAAHPLVSEKVDTSDLKTATVTLPEGMTPNESALAGIEGCTPEQIGIGTRNSVTCPPGSRIGTFNLEVPTLPAGQLSGPIFLGKPATGPITEPPFTIYLDAESSRYGVKVRLRGTVEANRATGQLTATFAENPPAPFTAAVLHFNGGAHATVANPLACTAGKTVAEFVPFSAPLTNLRSEPAFTSEGCSTPLPFTLTQSTSAEPATAGASSTATFVLSRSDGNQYPATLRTVLPPGMVGRIPAATQCPEAQANSEAEACPASSLIGSVRATVGAGPEPYPFTGSVYLTGPYAGAPYGLSLKVPVIAGPFNLGTEVKRAKIEVDPRTARVIVTSPLPTIRRGIPVRLRSLTVTVNRQGFELNPTNCGLLSAESTLSSTTGALTTVPSTFQAEGCSALAFKPSFTASTSAKTSKANGASLEVKVSQPFGQANINSVVTSLPKQLPSRLTTLQKACLEATFAANPLSCPAASNVGTATAVTPVLPHPMSGPAYLVSHGGAAFPDLDLVLEGDGVRIILVGNTDIKNGITTTTFASSPDVPVSSFVLKLPTGPHSALAANGNLCASKLVLPTTITGHNGAQVKQNTPIGVTGCGVRIVRRRVSHGTVTLTVQVFEAGRLSVGGTGLRGVSRRLGKAATVTLKLPLSAGGKRRHKPFRTRVKVSFVPSNHGPHSSASTVLRVR